jgi:phosphoenolpyruvate synthase/pyruvate phosphate dikinase
MRIKYKGKSIATPEGAFAIPMKYYFQHIKKYGIDRLIHQLLASNESLSSQKIRALLQVIADSIEQSPFDMSLAALIEKKIIQNNAGKRYRFRSSSNAEDLEGFNGAGLYTSETGIVGSKSKSIEIAIKKVWASLWNSRAYEERALAGVNQETVGMAILAHRSFPGEYVNGVAITRNLYRDFDFGFVINIQKGDNSLVKPSDSVSCEQFISYYNTADPFFNNKQAVEYLSLSSLNNNIPLLTREEIFDLTQKLDRIKNRFYLKLKKWKTMQYKDFAMDVEFKFDAVGSERRLYFKQARPFN